MVNGGFSGMGPIASSSVGSNSESPFSIPNGRKSAQENMTLCLALCTVSMWNIPDMQENEPMVLLQRASAVHGRSSSSHSSISE